MKFILILGYPQNSWCAMHIILSLFTFFALNFIRYSLMGKLGVKKLLIFEAIL
jgi:hypothetical protein